MSHGLRLDKENCSFMMSEVEYFRHKISAAGLETIDSKVASVLKAPTPENVQELRTLSTIMADLYIT